jgi:hypothetical protein
LKKNRKNGSLANGELGVRTIWVDEMFVTLEIARWATPVRSGSAAGIATGARAVCVAALPVAGLAVPSLALRIRPVTTSPAKNAIDMKNAKTAILRAIIEPLSCVPAPARLSAA